MALASKIKLFIIGLLFISFLHYSGVIWLIPRHLSTSRIHQIRITQEYMISPEPCSIVENLYMVAIVGSHPDHEEIRDVIRTTWGNPRLKGFPFKVLFTFGKLTNESQQINLQQESMKHGDILQGATFTDSYHSITYRDIMSFQWVLDNCPKTKFILKGDDDVALNIYNIINMLEKNQYSKSKVLVACSIVFKGGEVLRSGRYAVSYKDFPNSTYPDYCSGLAYILNPESASILVKMSKINPPIWMNDAYITGILTNAADISLTDLKFQCTFYPTETVDVIKSDQTHLYNLLTVGSDPYLMRKVDTMFYYHSVKNGLF